MRVPLLGDLVMPWRLVFGLVLDWPLLGDRLPRHELFFSRVHPFGSCLILRIYNARGGIVVQHDVGGLSAASDGAKSLAFKALDLGRIGAAPALQVEVLADRFVK
jgi:hypothetical protein